MLSKSQTGKGQKRTLDICKIINDFKCVYIGEDDNWIYAEGDTEDLQYMAEYLEIYGFEPIIEGVTISI